MSVTPEEKSEDQAELEYVENECFIGYTSEPPTLQHIAAVSIASRLWSEPDVREDVMRYSEELYFDIRTYKAYKQLEKKVLKKLEEKVLKKLDHMHLPNTLECKISSIFRPIGLQLFKGFAKETAVYYCCREHVQKKGKVYCSFYDIFQVGGSVYWTMEGIIDNVASLKEVIRNENREKDFYGLYELACKYCLEEYIPDLWRNISSVKEDELDGIYENYDYHIVAYWTASLENKLPTLLSKLKQSDAHNIYDTDLNIEQIMISLSIFVKNPYSLKYFWYKLKEPERNTNLGKRLSQAMHKWHEYEYHNCNDKTNILCFLLSKLENDKEQKKHFQDHSKKILKAIFYDWPWQRFFLPTFSIMSNYISEEDFVEIMTMIAKEIKIDRTLIKVFREIWMKSSLKLKKSLIQFFEDSTIIIHRFLKIDDVETISMILNYATAEETKQILFHLINSYELYAIIKSNKLSLIDTLITEYLTSSDLIIDFKHNVMSKYATDLCESWMRGKNFEAVEMLFAWAFESPSEIKDFKEKIIDKNEIYTSLVFKGDFELVNQFLNWCFESEDDIVTFKKAFIHEVDEDNSSICSHLLYELSRYEHGWELFEKFVNFNFCSPEEVSEFKYKFLASVTSFLDSYRFEFAFKFVNWCLGSVDEGNRYKNSFATSEKGMQFLIHAVNKGYPVWNKSDRLLRFFSLTKESVDKLKCKLDNIEYYEDYCSESVANFKRWSLLYLLDKRVSNNTDCKSDFESSDDEEDIRMEIINAYCNEQ